MTITDRINGVQTSLAVKAPCQAVSNANLTLSGEQTVNGIAVVEGDRVLVKDQDDATENGIYVVYATAWQRAADFDGNRDVVQGTLVLVFNAIAQGVIYQVTTADPIVIGTSEIAFDLDDDPAITYEQTQPEIDAGVTPSNHQYSPLAPYQLNRVLTPNSTGARAANSAALIALWDPTSSGPRGHFVFPNTTGSDIYYFDAQIIEVADNVHVDLQGCTLEFSGGYSAANDLFGFITCIRDVTIRNGTIDVDYDGSAGTNNGMALRIGGRKDYGFAGSADIEDEDFSVPMGNVTVDSLRVTTNNPGPEIAILLLGGLENVAIKNIVGDLQDVVEYLCYYEFGDYHYEATVANRTSSHANNLRFENIVGRNLKDDVSAGAVVAVVGANSAIIDGVHGDTCYEIVEARSGEALFYNVGAPYENGGRTRWCDIANVTGQNVSSHAIAAVGSESSSGGYLSGEGLSDAEQSDLLGFHIRACHVGASIYCNGPFSLTDSTIRGAGGSGSLIIGEDCQRFSLDNVGIFDGAGPGIRGEIDDSIRSSPREKTGEVRNSKVCGNTGQGMLFGLCSSVRVINNQIGYNADDVDDTETQTTGVSVTSDGSGVVCDGNVVTTNSGTAYVKAGTGDRHCDLRNMRGEATYTAGQWKLDGIASDTATNIGDIEAAINTASKYAGKLVYDSSNKRVLRAAGATAASDWEVVDGSAQVTPTPS